jgi:hypothetical protein
MRDLGLGVPANGPPETTGSLVGSFAVNNDHAGRVPVPGVSAIDEAGASDTRSDRAL